MGSANERRRYNVTSSRTGWTHTQMIPEYVVQNISRLTNDIFGLKLCVMQVMNYWKQTHLSKIHNVMMDTLKNVGNLMWSIEKLFTPEHSVVYLYFRILQIAFFDRNTKLHGGVALKSYCLWLVQIVFFIRNTTRESCIEVILFVRGWCWVISSESKC